MSLLSDEHQAEIANLRATQTPTRRVVSPGAEAALYTPFQVLDHGFVRLVDYMGDDAAICQAARVSYGAGTKSVSNDEGLIRYLMRHWHSTPFEMCEIKLHMKLPVFIARQFIRHRTANVNETSARYSILDREFYIPAAEDLAAQSTTNNQGRGQVLEGEEAALVLEILKNDSARAYDSYESMISQDGQQGLARELARMNLPMNIYTSWFWKVDLHNLMHMLRLRQDHHAQKEIRDYADTIATRIVEPWVPIAFRAYQDYRQDAVSLSGPASRLVAAALADPSAPIEAKDFGLSGRELREILDNFPALAPRLGG